ncbi:Sir2 family NAD-dependent protein deacetylase [Auritidibacter ignavus]|uniref:protein acetyllysine N-acetyltransferase n=1 Tax=Auritidibacter ignavus TaxID=678932 RepID=A0AAJ6AHU5_9MICC|nr:MULTISPECIES: Sir2 family NAD-dependent protein deacetylase [Auritidibacter]PXA75237.1 NAD-dependent protein deacetylase [Auritidibacter sp. NML120779]PXA78283.1 NAD-dependent protein deacetylase [Auritidibacter sp. NML100628]WGH93007.1 Sir2 family NAD-dependent protein deacetylase [Auritidibacter ignavus]
MNSSSDRSVPYVDEAISVDHPAYATHQAALRSIARVVDDSRPLQNDRVASAGIGQLLRLRPAVLTGAGISTGSGIPDYRGPNGSLRHHRPMTYQEFRFDPVARHRYWARSFVGWRHLEYAQPNPGHQVLAQWAQAGIISGIVTQNVDGLHQRAAQELGDDYSTVVALHGDMSEIQCLNCGAVESRASLDRRLEEANPGFLQRADTGTEDINPDGDARLELRWINEFQMVGCLRCDSTALKPSVVYFGEAVPAERNHRVNELLAGSGALLVVGSSVAVMSGYRMVLDMVHRHQPVGIINAGPSRADARATFRWRADTSQALQWLDDQVKKEFP